MNIIRPSSPLRKSEVGEAVEDYQQQLQDSEVALGYLYGRGLEADVIAKAKLGYVEHPRQGHEKVRHRIAIPYHSTTGAVQIRFRAIGDSEPKYLGLAGDSTRLYNAHALAEHPNGDTAYICEGEMDTIVCHHVLGLKPAVGVAGIQAWKPHYKHLLEGFQNIIILCDNDDKGQGDKFGDELMEVFSGQDVRKVLMPTGFDLNSAYLDGGRHLIDWIQGSFDSP